MINGKRPLNWTFKTLRFGKGNTAEWHSMPFQFPVMAGAAMAAQAYMLAEAERGNMVVVSLEPCERLKAMTDRLAEHGVMLDELKRHFTRNGEVALWEIVHQIDPNWPNPWRDADDPDGLCICGIGSGDVRPNCPIHGDSAEIPA